MNKNKLQKRTAKPQRKEMQEKSKIKIVLRRKCKKRNKNILQKRRKAITQGKKFRKKERQKSC